MRFLAIIALVATAATAAPSAAPVNHAQLDVPKGKPQQVIVQSRTFAPGTQSGWHLHPGTEVAYLASGRLDLQVAGKTTALAPGDSFTMPRGVAHNGVNRGTEPAVVVITLLVDKGALPRQPVAPPKSN